MKAHWDSHIEGKQVARPSWELSALLARTRAPRPPGATPFTLLLQSPTPHPGQQPGVQMAQCGRLSVFALSLQIALWLNACRSRGRNGKATD